MTFQVAHRDEHDEQSGDPADAGVPDLRLPALTHRRDCDERGLRMSARLAHLLSARRSERGYTLLIVLGVMVVVSGLASAVLALAANTADIATSRVAGAAVLRRSGRRSPGGTWGTEQNPSGWSSCLAQATPTLVDADDPAQATNHPYQEPYTFLTRAAATSFSGTSYSACSSSTPDSVLDATPDAAGDIRIQVTGMRGARTRGLRTRREPEPLSFPRFLYYTNYEILDPNILWPNESSKESSTCSTEYTGRAAHRSPRQRLAQALTAWRSRR